MKNKKIIIIFVVIVIIIAIIFGIHKVRSSYLWKDGKFITDGKKDLIELIKGTKDPNVKKEQIDFLLQSNAITQEEANELY